MSEPGALTLEGRTQPRYCLPDYFPSTQNCRNIWFQFHRLIWKHKHGRIRAMHKTLCPENIMCIFLKLMSTKWSFSFSFFPTYWRAQLEWGQELSIGPAYPLEHTFVGKLQLSKQKHGFQGVMVGTTNMFWGFTTWLKDVSHLPDDAWSSANFSKLLEGRWCGSEEGQEGPFIIYQT